MGDGVSTVSLLHRRARLKTAYAGGSRRLLAELAEVGCCRLIDMTGRKGRPRERLQIEEIGEDQEIVAPVLGAVPTILGLRVVDTGSPG